MHEKRSFVKIVKHYCACGHKKQYVQADFWHTQSYVQISSSNDCSNALFVTKTEIVFACGTCTASVMIAFPSLHSDKI